MAMATYRVIKHMKMLIRTVARAFYTDEDCTVIDALLEQEYVSDSALNDLCNMKETQVRSILNNLLAEQVVFKEKDVEDIRTGQVKNSDYWYVTTPFTPSTLSLILPFVSHRAHLSHPV